MKATQLEGEQDDLNSSKREGTTEKSASRSGHRRPSRTHRHRKQNTDNIDEPVSGLSKTGLNSEKLETEERTFLTKSWTVCKFVLTIVFGYIILALVITVSKESEVTASNELNILKSDNRSSDAKCSANSFMIDDGVCDEATNIEQCLFDGGDCCLDVDKLRNHLCSNCTCILDVDETELMTKMSASDVHVYDYFKSIDEQFLTVEKIVNVISNDVCSFLCLTSTESSNIDSWIYQGTTCKCLQAYYCYMDNDLISIDKYQEQISDKNEGDTVKIRPYAIKTKWLQCLHWCFWNNRQIEAQHLPPSGEDFKTNTAEHCQVECQQNPECTFFTWVSPEYGQELWADPRLMRSCFLYNNANRNHFMFGMFSGPSFCNQTEAASNILYVITGIDNRGLKVDSPEMFNLGEDPLPDECSTPNILGGFKIAGATGKLVLKNILLACGGETIQSVGYNMEVCYGRNNDVFAILSEPRKHAASIVHPDGLTLWVTGGLNDHEIVLDTTDLVSVVKRYNEKGQFGKDVFNGPRLPQPLAHHCMTVIRNTTVMVTGDGLTWLFDFNSESWTDGPDFMDGSVLSHHSCGTILDSNDSKIEIVIIAGGFTNGSIVMVYDETRLFVVESDSWNDGPTLPHPIMNGAEVVTPNRLSLIIAGGSNSSVFGGVQSSIYQISCHSLECQWTKMDHELETARQGAIGTFIPDHLLDCS